MNKKLRSVFSVFSSSCCRPCAGQHCNTLPLRQVLQNVLNHSNKLALVKAELGSQQNLEQGGIKAETNGGGHGGSTSGSESESSPVTPPESQSPLHFLADLAEQKSREEKKGEHMLVCRVSIAALQCLQNTVFQPSIHPSIYSFTTHILPLCDFLSLPENKETVPLGKSVKEEKEGDSLEVLHQCKTTSLANSIEQGSTLRDLLTTTAGKLKLGSTDAGIAFAPVYSTASQVQHQLPVASFQEMEPFAGIDLFAVELRKSAGSSHDESVQRSAHFLCACALTGTLLVLLLLLDGFISTGAQPVFNLFEPSHYKIGNPMSHHKLPNQYIFSLIYLDPLIVTLEAVRRHFRWKLVSHLFSSTVSPQ